MSKRVAGKAEVIREMDRSEIVVIAKVCACGVALSTVVMY
jgi:hypothetical protein